MAHIRSKIVLGFQVFPRRISVPVPAGKRAPSLEEYLGTHTLGGISLLPQNIHRAVALGEAEEDSSTVVYGLSCGHLCLGVDVEAAVVPVALQDLLEEETTHVREAHAILLPLLPEGAVSPFGLFHIAERSSK